MTWISNPVRLNIQQTTLPRRAAPMLLTMPIHRFLTWLALAAMFGGSLGMVIGHG